MQTYNELVALSLFKTVRFALEFHLIALAILSVHLQKNLCICAGTFNLRRPDPQRPGEFCETHKHTEKMKMMVYESIQQYFYDYNFIIDILYSFYEYNFVGNTLQ